VRGYGVLLGMVLVWTTTIIPRSINESMAMALAHSPKIELAKARLAIAKSRQTEAYGQFLPSIHGAWQVGKEKSHVVGFPDRPATNQNTTQITIEQRLFQGFQSAHRVISEGHMVSAAQAELQQTVADVAFAAAEAHINVVTARHYEAHFKQSIAIADAMVKKGRQQLKLQAISMNQMSDYDADALRAYSDGLDAKKDRVSSEQSYTALTGDAPIGLLDPPWPSEPLSISELQAHAKEHHGGLLQMMHAQKSARAKLATAKGAFLPTAKLMGSIKKQDAVLYMNDQNIDTKQVVLDVSVPLFHHGQRVTALQQAYHMHQLKQKEFEVKDDEVMMALAMAVERYNLGHELVSAYWELQKMGRGKIRRLKEQLRLGAVSKLTVLTQQKELSHLSQRVVGLRKDVIMNYYKALYLSGRKDWYAIDREKATR